MAVLADPLALVSAWWPDVNMYDKQREILYSIWENDDTYSPASNQAGKDWIAALVALLFFLSRHPCRVVTTSAKDDHLDVLWGEMKRFISTCAFPLTSDKGGPLIVTHHNIRKIVQGSECGISYIKGMVASDDTIAAMQGHHVTPRTLEEANDGIPRSLFISDESSSVKQICFDMASTWWKRAFIFGNTWDCNNQFKWAVKGTPDGKLPGGNIPRPNGRGYYRYVVPIRAVDSPNVQLGLEQKARGIEPTNEILIPGLKSYADYVKHRQLWDEHKQCVSLDAQFYEGKDVLLFPPVWLNRAIEIDRGLQGRKRIARAIGVDCAQGGDSTSFVATDEFGVIEVSSQKTPDTSKIIGLVMAFARKWGCEMENILFDAGGGGYNEAMRMRAMGHMVRTVAFGEAATPVDKLKKTFRYRSRQEKVEDEETKYVYKNRRAEMYGIIRQLLDPVNEGFGIPAYCQELRRQLAPIPLWYDDEGRMFLPPKNKKPDTTDAKRRITMTELIGCSPDEADALALAVFGMTNKPTQVYAGAVG